MADHTASREGSSRDRALLFVVAVLVRGLVGWIFFGSVDLTNAILNSGRLFSGMPSSAIPVPYFPGVYQLLIWTSAQLASHTPLPLAFCYKLFPILFDGVLAVLVYDYLMPARRRAIHSGLLYAFSPVSVIVTAVHTQWDSIALAFLLLALLLAAKRSALASAFSGVAFLMSVLVKPMAVPFLPLLFPPPWRMLGGEAKQIRAQVVATLSAMAACLALYLGVLYAIGDPLTAEVVRGILTYAERGIQLHGLQQLVGGGANRLLSLTPLLLLVPLYWKNLLSREEAVLLALAALIGTSGIGPQYLLWMVPFLLICVKVGYAALYNLLAGIFLIIFYQTPGLAGHNMENLGAFGPLESFAWLAPAATLTDVKALLFVILGDFLIPVSALAFFLLELLKAGRRAPQEQSTPPFSLRQLLAPIAGAIAIVLVLTLVARTLSEPSAGDYDRIVHKRASEYAMRLYTGPGLVHPSEPAWVIPAFAGEPVRPSAVDATSIGCMWVLLWSVAVFFGHPWFNRKGVGLSSRW